VARVSGKESPIWQTRTSQMSATEIEAETRILTDDVNEINARNEKFTKSKTNYFRKFWAHQNFVMISDHLI